MVYEAMRLMGKIWGSDYAKRVFLHHLSSCVEAGIDLPECLDACAREAPRGLRPSVRAMKRAIEEGYSLSEAFRTELPRLFPKSYYAMVELGERSGNLSAVLNLLDSQYDETTQMARRAEAVAVYPIAVGLFCAGITLFLLTKVTPAFQEIYVDLGGQLPLPTRILTRFVEFLKSHALLSVAVMTGLVFALYGFVGAARRWRPFHLALLRIPLLGPLVCHFNQFRVSSLMSILLEAGMSSQEALSLCASEALWPEFRDSVRRASFEVAQGKALAEAVSSQRAFSPTLAWLVSAGEQRGDLSGAFKTASECERARMQRVFGLWSQFLQPAIVLLLGLVIGLVIVALWLPLLKFPDFFFIG